MNEHRTIEAAAASGISHLRDNVLPFERPAQGDDWCSVVAAIGQPERLSQRWAPLFAPLVAAGPSLVIGQLGQSLDGRIATETGHSQHISGADGLLHLHRLRSLVDAVVIGVGTAIADDPLLTVRLCDGPHPTRVVIDPAGRLPADSRLYSNAAAPVLVLSAAAARSRAAVDAARVPAHVETVPLPSRDGVIAPADILAALRERGLGRILIEGGAATLSHFIAAGMLDRLHMLTAPIILGSGQPGLDLPPIDRLDRALRPKVKAHLIGDEVVFDCDFRAMADQAP